MKVNNLLTRFTGCWKLVTTDLKNSKTNETVHPWGKNIVGRLMYIENKMSVIITDLDRPKFSSVDPNAATDSENRKAMNGMIVYFGDVEIEEENGIIKHHVIGSHFPNLEGGISIRYFKFIGKDLVLSVKDLLIGGIEVSGSLTWEKEA